MRCPSDIRANIDANATALVNWTEPVPLDNSNLPPQVTVVPAGISPPHVFNKTTLIVYTAIDTSGNKRECSFRVVLKGGSEKVALIYIWMWLILKTKLSPEQYFTAISTSKIIIDGYLKTFSVFKFCGILYVNQNIIAS